MLALAARSGQGCAWLRSRRARKSAAVLTALARRSVQMLSGRGAPRTLVATRSPRGVEQGALMPVQSRRRRLPYGGRPHKFDQVLGLAALAIQRVVQPLRAAAPDVGHDVADVQSVAARLDARTHAALAFPGLGPTGDLGVAPPKRSLPLGVARPHIVCALPDLPIQHIVAAEAEDVVDAVGLTPRPCVPQAGWSRRPRPAAP